MRALALSLVVGVALVACGDDGGHLDPTLETTLDSQPPALTNNPQAVFEFHSDPAGDEFVCQVDGGEQVQCHDPFTTTVGDGPHVFLVATLGPRATLDPTPAMAMWTVDTTAPDTAITQMPAAVDNSTAPTFAFTSPDTTATFECAVDGGAFAACATPDTLAVADGSHAFAVRAKDAAGNVDPSPATYTWLVDTSTPDTLIASGPLDGATTGTATSFTFNSPNTADATFECALDGAAFATCASPAAFTGLVGGAHAFVVRAKDVHGVVDPTPAQRAWTVDATPPDVAITTKPADPSNDATPTFGFTSTDATATFECQIEGASTYAACTSPWDGPTIGEGSHKFDVRATDPYGNSAVASYTWTVDLTPPTVAITSGPTGATAQKSPSFAFTVTPAAPAECALDAGAFAACTSPFATTNLADGAHTVTVRATDPAGNTGSAMRSFTVDTTPPAVTFTVVPTSPTNDNTPTWAFTTDTPGATLTCKVDAGAAVACNAGTFTSTALADGSHTLTVAATDAVGNTGAGMSTVTIDTTTPVVTITSGPTTSPPTSDNTPTFGFTISEGAATCAVDGGAAAACSATFTAAPLADGNHTLVVTATDAAGNVGTGSRAFAVDTTKPVVTFTSGPQDPTPTNDSTPTFGFTTTEGTTTCAVDGGAAAACTSPTTTAALGDGPHAITVTATDAAGNTGSATRMFTVDTTKPVVTITAGPMDPTPTNDNTPTFAFTTTEGTTTCAIDAGVAAACTATFTATTLADGAHKLTVTATDTAGNTGSATRNFTVDTAPPTITFTAGPQDPTPTKDNTPTFAFTLSADAVAGSAKCAIDGGAATACSSPITTATLGDGAHAITVTATDAAGNPGTATRAFTVDTASPTVAITSGPMDPTPTNDSTPTFAFTVTGGPATTTCAVDGGAAAACTSPVTTAALADGGHTLTVVATDLAGNPGSTTRAFTVDTTKPVVTITSGPLDPTPTNDTTPTFTFTTTEGTTTCQIDTGAATACTGTYTAAALGDGAHKLVVTATDAAGNVGSATRNFTIDTAPPAVVFDDVPPAAWPVNYYNIAWHATETATFKCSINGGAFAACTAGSTVNFAYTAAEKFSVQATDTAGNSATYSTAWSSQPGLVLHYAWEQGSLKNTSLLAQRAAYSPKGSTAGSVVLVGGWAGTAQSQPPVETYPSTQTPLSSSPNAAYAASIWVRPTPNASGVVWSNLDATLGGIQLLLEGTSLTVTLSAGGTNSQSGSIALTAGEWNQVAIRTNGTNQGLDVFRDGNIALTLKGIFAPNGFGANQAKNLTVGNLKNADVDDLRFYNETFADAEMCTTVARGVYANLTCNYAPPMLELAFENSISDTGVWHLPIKPPNVVDYSPVFKLGSAYKIGVSGGFTESGFSTAYSPTANHTLAMWFDAPGTLTLFDDITTCGSARIICGMRITATPSSITIDSYHQVVTIPGTPTKTLTIPIAGGSHSLVVAEQKTTTTDATDMLAVYIDGSLGGVLDIANTYNAWSPVSDVITYTPEAAGAIDEVQLWQRDISPNADELCENGFDGEWDPANNKCTLTSN